MLAAALAASCGKARDDGGLMCRDGLGCPDGQDCDDGECVPADGDDGTTVDGGGTPSFVGADAADVGAGTLENLELAGDRVIIEVEAEP